jgi:hypothetical protein
MRHSSSSWFGQLGLILGLSVALSGCAVDPRDAGDDIVTGTPGGNESDRCVRGETRCYGGALQSCDSGTYKTSKVCGTGQICDPKRGCLDCSPVLPTTCVGDKVHTCNADGSIGTEQETCQPKACSGGRCSTVCSPGSELIYVVDSDNRLLSFNPRDGKYEFKLIGTLSCPAGSSFGGGKATPFSMAVDRQARAWVLYSRGEIFWVSTTDASCKSSGFAKNQSSFETFGMGFVSDAEGSEKETLFVAGGSYSNQNVANLASIDASTLKLSKIAGLSLSGQSSPELSGTGKGELYGYYPGGSPFIGQIDKASAGVLRRWTLSSMGSSPSAWAFAHWGGRFYLFITANVGVSTRSMVYEFDPATGKAVEIKTSASYRIVGAGVSTCAPVIIG